MDNIVAVLMLASIPFYLGFRHFIEFSDRPFSKENFGVISLLALILYWLYFLTLIHVGKEGLYELESGRQSRKFTTFFIYPSIGFGLAIFPKIASEYILDAFSIIPIRMKYQICAFIGWAFIIDLFIVLLF